MTPIGSAAIALGFAVFANFQGAYLKDSSDEIEYLDQQASLHTGGCSGRCQYQMWMDRYPSIVLGESYNGDDPMNQALREFDPQFENPQAREWHTSVLNCVLGIIALVAEVLWLDLNQDVRTMA